jgi:hypothetical protein
MLCIFIVMLYILILMYFYCYVIYSYCYVMYFYCYVIYSYCYVFLLLCYVFLLLCYVLLCYCYCYCYVCPVLCVLSQCAVLCVNVDCTAATGISGHFSTTLTEVFRASSSVVRQMPGYTSQRRDTARTSQIFFLLLCMFRSLNSVYCLCVNVYCTAATGCQPNCS